MTPAVSVLLATFNNARDLPQVLRSLQGQTLTSFEVVAINDGSTDGSGELLDQAAATDSRFRVIHQENAGLMQSLRRACDEARAPLLARQDADDISAPTRLARQVDYLARHPRVVACGTWSWTFHPRDGVVQVQRVPDRPSLLRRYLDRGWNPLVHGSVMMRSDAYQRAAGGGYRLPSHCEDFDLWLQLSELGDLGMVESEEYLYHLNAGGLSFGADEGAPLIHLALRLAQERRQFGAERSSLIEEVDRLRGVVRTGATPSQRAAAAAYSSGIAALRAGQYERFRACMREASGESGPMADRARQRLRLGNLVPALPAMRALYALRLRGTPLTHIQAVPPAATLPGWVEQFSAAACEPSGAFA